MKTDGGIGRVWRRGLSGVVLLSAFACGGDSSGPDDGGGNQFSATINGTAWSAAPGTILVTAGAPGRPGSLLLQGATMTNPVRSLSFDLSRIPGPGTYRLGINTGTGTGGTATVVQAPQSWLTPLSGAAGSITISSLTATRVSGTFQFEAEPLAAGGGPVTVTNGAFNVPLPAGFSPASADQLGNSVTATLGGTPWHAATVVLTGTSGTTLGLGASTTTHTVLITAGQIMGPGTAPFSHTAVPIRRITVIPASGTAGWGGTAADQGTFTITDVTATRITGTFTGTLAPSNPGSGLSPLPITGTFDVRIVP